MISCVLIGVLAAPQQASPLVPLSLIRGTTPTIICGRIILHYTADTIFNDAKIALR
jgi:hypothetical protein